jgi:hypothetical protein
MKQQQNEIKTIKKKTIEGRNTAVTSPASPADLPHSPLPLHPYTHKTVNSIHKKK